jgi:hypothetical protein
LIKLIGQFEQLGYSDFRSLVAILNKGRDKVFGQVLADIAGIETPQLQRCAEILGEIRKNWGASKASPNALAAPAEIASQDSELMTDVLLLLRLSFSPGINILNPDWSAGLGSYCPAHEVVKLQIANTKGTVHPEAGIIQLQPHANGSGVRIKYLPQGKSWGEIAEGNDLRPGQTVTIGRNISIRSSAFGMESLTKLTHQPELAIDSKYWSRGGVVIILDHSNQLWLLDRGSTNSLAFQYKSGAGRRLEGTYVPEPVKTEGPEQFGTVRYLDT